MNEQAQIAETVKAVVAEIAPILRDTLPPDMRLWDAQTCAVYFKVSRDYFYKHIAANPTFPAPAVELNKLGKLRTQRWRPKDVMRWRG